MRSRSYQARPAFCYSGTMAASTGLQTPTLQRRTIDPTWFNMDTGINTIEFYSGDISGNFANAASPQANGGAQDNGSSSVTFNGHTDRTCAMAAGRGRRRVLLAH